MSAVAFRGVSARYGRRAVLHDVDADLPSGALTALVGPNGSGKSTLLATLTGGSATWTGAVTLDGADVAAMRPRERARRVGALPQDHLAPAELTAAELVELGLGAAPGGRSWMPGPSDRAAHRAAVDAALTSVGALGLTDRMVATLSGGERQRVLLARALVAGPDVLVLDEPTNHLDPRHQLDVLDLAATSGRTVVAALHALDLAAQYAAHVLVLDGGRVVAAGPPSVAFTPDLLARVFGVRGRLHHDEASGTTHLLVSSRPR